MVRSKVKLTYIQDDSARRATYRKRSKGLMKKASELSTLCDIQACAIVYGPYSGTPEVWPSQEGAREVLTRLRNMPEYQQGVRKADQESFTKERIKKEEEKLKKYQMQNYRNDMTRLMYKRMRGEATSKASLDDLIEMGSISDQKMKEIAARLEKIKIADGMLGGNVNQGVEASHGTRERAGVGQRLEMGNGQNFNISSSMPMVQAHGFEGQLNGVLYNQQGYNWEGNSMLFPGAYDGNSVKRHNTNR